MIMKMLLGVGTGLFMVCGAWYVGNYYIMNGMLALLAYIIGSIPSGFVVARMCGIEDIRSFGSGNIGATNVGRALGKKYFFVVFFADFLKSYLFLAMLNYRGVHEPILLLSAVGLLLGNCFSYVLDFQGGKGVATLVGIVAALFPAALLIFLLIWGIMLAVTKTVGISSVVACVTLPLSALLLKSDYLIVMYMIGAAVLIVYKHRSNIASYRAK